MAVKTVREFIYVDIERVYSLYSQVGEGIEQKIQKSISDADIFVNSKSPVFSGKQVEHHTGDTNQVITDFVLHDHLYNLLETKLGNNIADITSLDFANGRKGIAGSTIIKITGQPEIEDYGRLSEILANFNTIGFSLNYLTHSATIDELKKLKKNIENREINVTDPNKIKAAKRQKAEQIQQVDQAIAQQLEKNPDLHLDEEFVSALSVVLKSFMTSAFDILITPNISTVRPLVVRGVLDPNLLRIRADLLRRRYGDEIQAQWTLVGQVTRLPVCKEHGESSSPIPIEASEDSSNQPDNNQVKRKLDEAQKATDPKKGMLDAIRVMNVALQKVEQTTMESELRDEILVAPLAVYQTITLNSERDDLDNAR
jgi:hypothetical protein